MMISRTRARSAEQYVSPRCWHSTTSNAGGSNEYETNSSRALPEWLEIGKIDVNAACRPSFLRVSPGVSDCKNARYETSCVSSRNGTGRTLARFAKLLRMRFFSVNEYVDKGMPSPVLHEAGMPRARDHLVRPRGPSRFRVCALAERAPVVHRLVKGTLHSRGLVAGRYQPLADGDTLIRVARPCLAFCSRIRKRSETNSNCCELRFASISDRSGRRAATASCLYSSKSSGSARDLPPSSFSNATPRCDSSAANPAELGFAANLIT